MGEAGMTAHRAQQTQVAALEEARRADQKDKILLLDAKIAAEKQLSLTIAELESVRVTARNANTARKSLKERLRALEKENKELKFQHKEFNIQREALNIENEALRTTLDNRCTILEEQAKEQLETHAVDVALLHQAAAHADQETAHREIELQETRQSLQQTCARVKKLEAQLAQQRQLRRDALKQLCTVSTERDSTVRAHMATLKELEEAGAQVVQLQKKLDTKTGQLLDSETDEPRAKDEGGKLLREKEALLEEQQVQLRAQTAQQQQLQAQLQMQATQLQAAGAEVQRLQQWLEETLAAIPIISETDCTLVGRLGSGGCATVDLYEVKLAVKKPRTEEDALRLRKEAFGMAGLNHPNIAKPVCWIRPADGGPLALAMPYLSAGTLDSVLWPPGGAIGRRPPMRALLMIISELADALQHAHARGIIHSDIKPENMLLGQDGRVIITDFGFCYDVAQPPALWSGTICYGLSGAIFHPELKGVADDVHGLLATAWEMLLGERPLQCELAARYSAHNVIEEFAERITERCQRAGLDASNEWIRVAAAECMGYSGLNEADFEPALRDQEMPREFVRLLQRGLCQQAASGMATMPTLQELREVLQREIENLAQP